MICPYCHQTKKQGWHDCAQAKKARRRIGDALCAIDELMRGGVDDDSPEHRKELLSIATQVKMMGKETRI